MTTEKTLVSIVMGSDSDLDRMNECAKILDEFDIPFEITISSAHRSPKATMEYAESARNRGIEVIVAGAGRAAHLAGVIAAHTTLPVIGVPIDGGPLNGIDALYSTVQMPMAIGSGGARNAGIFAAQILSIKYPDLQSKLKQYKETLSQGVAEKANRLADVGYENY